MNTENIEKQMAFIKKVNVQFWPTVLVELDVLHLGIRSNWKNVKDEILKTTRDGYNLEGLL